MLKSLKTKLFRFPCRLRPGNSSSSPKGNSHRRPRSREKAGSLCSSKIGRIFWQVRWQNHLVLLGLLWWSVLVSTLQNHTCPVAGGEGSDTPSKQHHLMYPSQTTRTRTWMQINTPLPYWETSLWNKLSTKLNSVPSNTIHLQYDTGPFSHPRLVTECGSTAGPQTTPWIARPWVAGNFS